ncbi:MAG: hypothetical protein HY268_01955 [Deltaproteobacteria bacterium]|nr:hypothetical protein [Deltaproteobacteria bacterium]
MTPHEPSLPTNHAFVVQFRTETELEHGRCTGRVEHVVSGQATHFASLEELVAFMGQVLTAVRAPHRQNPGGGGV